MLIDIKEIPSFSFLLRDVKPKNGAAGKPPEARPPQAH
jgi:hypothetical protein